MIASNSVGLNCFCISLRLKVKISKMSRNDYSKKETACKLCRLFDKNKRCLNLFRLKCLLNAILQVNQVIFCRYIGNSR
jgi:hypothetical protein